MAFQWLSMRISEERDRLERQRTVLERLPVALEELYAHLAGCVAEYKAAFGDESASITLRDGKLTVEARHQVNGEWISQSAVEIVTVTRLPGFEVTQGDKKLDIEVGMLPGARLFHKDGDQFLTEEELTRRILDRALFPKLTE